MEIRLEKSITPLDLESTLKCGQVFRWERIGSWWYGVVDENVVKVKQIGNKLFFFTYPGEEDDEFIEKYFRLDDDLPYILYKINNDEYVNEAIQRFYGLRVIRQNSWECLVSYICATRASIPAIKSMIRNLSRRFGRKIVFDGQRFYTFPKPDILAKASLKELRYCKLGYRAKYVLDSAKIVDNLNFNFEKLMEMDYREAREILVSSFPGVGQKVADCILLFSCGKLEAFPVDIWIKRVVLKFYGEHFDGEFRRRFSIKKSITPKEYEKISSFGRTYFGKYAGYAQEYLFYLARKESL